MYQGRVRHGNGVVMWFALPFFLILPFYAPVFYLINSPYLLLAHWFLLCCIRFCMCEGLLWQKPMMSSCRLLLV